MSNLDNDFLHDAELQENNLLFLFLHCDLKPDLFLQGSHFFLVHAFYTGVALQRS